jgi:succinate dehydrogenase / fumarate reductase, cytochrome b subunit
MGSFRWRAIAWFAWYRGQSGQWAQLLHRLTGLGVVFFLSLHILDTSLVAFGPGAYDTVTAIYHNFVVRLLEVVLVGLVIYHALNGLRVTVVDLWDEGSLYQAQMWGVVILLFLALFLPSAFFMLAPYFR